jgi:hypothetical protein
MLSDAQTTFSLMLFCESTADIFQTFIFRTSGFKKQNKSQNDHDEEGQTPFLCVLTSLAPGL